MRKFLVIIGDGMAGWPLKNHENKTTLELATTTNLDFLTQNGELGLVKNVPDGLPPGSDVANLSIFGYNPELYYQGRASIEAVSQNIHLDKDDVVFRVNIVFMEQGIMKDFTAHHIGNEEAHNIISLLNEKMRDRFPFIEFYPGVSYRNLMVIKNEDSQSLTKITTCPPHDITDKPVVSYLPQSDLLLEIMQEANNILRAAHRNESIWLWGQGGKFAIPNFKVLFNLEGVVITAVDLVKGIGLAAGLKYLTVPGITGFIDTNFTGKARYALEALKNSDIAFIHVEAPDEAGHMGDLALKKKAIEEFDEKVVGTILRENTFEELAILVLPDHATPLEIKTHSADAVPYVIYRNYRHVQGSKKYCEKEAVNNYVDEGYKLLGCFIKG